MPDLRKLVQPENPLKKMEGLGVKIVHGQPEHSPPAYASESLCLAYFRAGTVPAMYADTLEDAARLVDGCGNTADIIVYVRPEIVKSRKAAAGGN